MCVIYKCCWFVGDCDGSSSCNTSNNILLFYCQKVDAKKLEKAEAKLQQKQEKRSQDSANSRNTVTAVRLESATASQVTSKKEAKMEDKGNNRAQDIRIENFDVAFGNRCVDVCCL